MGKDKRPRRRKDPAAETDAAEEQEAERQTEPKGELVPPARRPPTAVAAETPPPPEPVQHSRVEVSPSPVLLQLVEALRLVAGTMIDIADAAADALMKRLEGRA